MNADACMSFYLSHW